LIAEFCTGGCEERTRAREAEESELLETVAREWLMRNNRLIKGIGGAVMICELWTLVVAL
jgi:hypothetical protein